MASLCLVLFFCERAPPPGLSVGLSPVVFLLALCFPSPASSWVSGLRMLQVSWRLPGDETEGGCVGAIPSQDGPCLIVTKHCCPRGKQEWFPLAQRPQCRMFWIAKPWVASKGQGWPPFFHRAPLCFALLVPTLLVPVRCQYCQGRAGSERRVWRICSLYLCLPDIAALTPVKPLRISAPADSFSGFYHPVSFPSCSLESHTGRSKRGGSACGIHQHPFSV